MVIFRRGPRTVSKIVIFDHNGWLWHRSLLDRRVSSTFRRRSIGYNIDASSVSRDQQTPLRHASANLFNDRKPRQNLTVRTDKSEDEVTNNKRRLVLLKLTTDRHAASRRLSATAELLVWYRKSARDAIVGGVVAVIASTSRQIVLRDVCGRSQQAWCNQSQLQTRESSSYPFNSIV